MYPYIGNKSRKSIYWISPEFNMNIFLLMTQRTQLLHKCLYQISTPNIIRLDIYERANYWPSDMIEVQGSRRVKAHRLCSFIFIWRLHEKYLSSLQRGEENKKKISLRTKMDQSMPGAIESFFSFSFIIYWLRSTCFQRKWEKPQYDNFPSNFLQSIIDELIYVAHTWKLLNN